MSTHLRMRILIIWRTNLVTTRDSVSKSSNFFCCSASEISLRSKKWNPWRSWRRLTTKISRRTCSTASWPSWRRRQASWSVGVNLGDSSVGSASVKIDELVDLMKTWWKLDENSGTRLSGVRPEPTAASRDPWDCQMQSHQDPPVLRGAVAPVWAQRPKDRPVPRWKMIGSGDPM